MTPRWWPLIGLVTGALTGALWGWLGSNGYEANDSMLGTAFLCALAGTLLGGIAYHLTRNRKP